MKLKMLALVCAFAGSSALACPDLRGTYTCEGEPLTVDQMEDGGITYYILNDNAIPADGQEYPLADEAEMRNQTVKFYCSEGLDSQFLIDYKGDYYQGNVKQGLINNTTRVSKDNNGNLKFNDSGTFTPVDDKAGQSWEEVSFCTKS